MNRKRVILLSIFVIVFVCISEAQDKIHLFPDRTSCISGDTIWFNAILFNQFSDNSGNVIHLQLDNLTNDHITKVSVVCKGNNADGYLPIPDSLSTGVYVLKAFTNLQKSNPEAVINQRLLVVYNRFESVINLVKVPELISDNFENIPGISINTSQQSLKMMDVKIDLPENLCSEAMELIVTARLADPLADQLSSGWISSKIEDKAEPYMAVNENKGVVVKGRVYSKTDGTSRAGTTVLLSISDTLPYLDYCISDEQGRFFFYIRNAVGTGNLVLQELGDKTEDTGIELFQNFVETHSLSSNEKILTNEQRSYSTNVIKASYFNKFFYRSQSLAKDTFSIQKDFMYPFYGPPTESFYPELFVDLDNFAEISREILRGVQYRVRKGQASIRMFDYGTQSIFKSEPFKLLDGIPVQDPDFFSNMGTTKIKKVDVVFYKRFFGDLDFNGVLAVYSNNPTLGWVESLPGISLIRYACLQPKRKWNYSNQTTRYSNMPDFKKVLLRERLENIHSSNSFSFDISNIEGKLLIEVIIVCKDNGIYQSRKLFETGKQEAVK